MSLYYLILLSLSYLLVGYIDFLSLSHVVYPLLPLPLEPPRKFIIFIYGKSILFVMIKSCLINLELVLDFNSLVLSIIKNEHPDINTSKSLIISIDSI